MGAGLEDDMLLFRLGPDSGRAGAAAGSGFLVVPTEQRPTTINLWLTDLASRVNVVATKCSACILLLSHETFKGEKLPKLDPETVMYGSQTAEFQLYLQKRPERLKRSRTLRFDGATDGAGETG